MAAKQMSPAEISGLANTVRIALKEAFERVSDQKVEAAWQILNEADLYGYEGVIGAFDLKQLKSDLFIMEAAVSLFAKEMADMGRG